MGDERKNNDLEETKILIDIYKHLDGKIRENLQKENTFFRFFLYLAIGFILPFLKKSSLIDIKLYFLILILYPHLFIFLLTLRGQFLKELYVSGGYKKALEEIINHKLQANILLWENVLVPKFLRLSMFTNIFYFYLLIIPIIESFLIYKTAYEVGLQFLEKYIVIIILLVSSLLFISFFLLLILEYRKSVILFEKTYYLVFFLLKFSKINTKS